MAPTQLTVTLELTGEQLDLLALRVAEIVVARTPPTAPTASAFLSVREASELLRASRQRIYDLLSDGRLTRHKDGSRVLLRRDEIEQYLRGESVGPVARARRTSNGKARVAVTPRDQLANGYSRSLPDESARGPRVREL